MLHIIYSETDHKRFAYCDVRKREKEREREREREKEKPEEELTRSLQLTLAMLQAITSFGPSYLSLVAVSARLHVGAPLAFMTAHMQYRLHMSNYSCVQNYSCVR